MRTGRPKVVVTEVCGTALKVCPSCKITKPLSDYAKDDSKSDGVTSWCKLCRSMKRQIRRSLGHIEKQYNRPPEKDYAKSAVGRALITGRLVRATVCEICENNAFTEAHHYDYSQPYNVHWLCKDCHAFVHSHTTREIYERLNLKYERVKS